MKIMLSSQITKDFLKQYKIVNIEALINLKAV